LSDERFDFSDAYILSTGCAGSAEGYGIMGDVFVITAAADYDLASEDSEESVDIFAVAMKNNFDVSRVVIDAILNNEF